MFAYKTEKFPAREFLICQSLFAVYECFVGSDESVQKSEFDKKVRQNLQDSIKTIVFFEDDVVETVVGKASTTNRITELWQELLNLDKKTAYKLIYFIRTLRPDAFIRASDPLVRWDIKSRSISAGSVKQ